MNEIERIELCAEYLKDRISTIPDTAIILGSGLGALAEKLEDSSVIEYGEIPGFPVPTVKGHRGEMLIGKIDGKLVIAMAGRFHYYEGHDLDTVVFPVRVLAGLGIKKLLITNAAGGVNTDFVPGDMMLIEDHLNMTGQNPLVGDNIKKLGTRFPDMSAVYSTRLKKHATDFASENNLVLKHGVYAWMSGPSYETPAEIKMLRILGADAVGMSTVPEAIAASHAGMEVAGISLITNMAAGILDNKLNHEEVTKTAKAAEDRFLALVRGLLLLM